MSHRPPRWYHIACRRFGRTTATLTKVGVTENQFAPLAACETVAALVLRIQSA